MEEFDYRIRWRSAEVLPGAHRGLREGPGVEFHGHVGMLDAPDPRRLDLRASIANPGGGWLFRRMRQTSGIGVVLLADVSASMGAGGAARPVTASAARTTDAAASRMPTLARLLRMIGQSARRTSDSFSLIAADAAMHEALFLPPTRAPGAIADIAARVAAFVPSGRGHAGVIEAAENLAGRRRLVFVASDFCWPLADVERLLAALAPHQVQPIVLWDDAGTRALKLHGLVELDDAEGGAGRAVWLRPRQRERWQSAIADWRAQLAETFAAHGVAPLFVDEGFAADAIADWLREGA